MAETVKQVLDRILANARRLNLRSAPEPDTADEDEEADARPTPDTAPPEKTR